MIERGERDGVLLTRRQQDVLRSLKAGRSTAETASLLAISERTVKFHVSNVMKKLHAVNRAHALAIVLEQKLLR